MSLSREQVAHPGPTGDRGGRRSGRGADGERRPRLCGIAAARWACAARSSICCGKGNNGGDGFVIARHLDNRRRAVRMLLFARPEELTGDAAIKYRIIAHRACR